MCVRASLYHFPTVVDCTGIAAVMSEALPLLRDIPWDEAADHVAPQYIVQGSYAGDMQFDYDTAFRKQAVILIPRDRTTADRIAVMGLLASQSLRIGDLITHTPDPNQADLFYAQLRDPNASVMGVAFKW